MAASSTPMSASSGSALPQMHHSRMECAARQPDALQDALDQLRDTIGCLRAALYEISVEGDGSALALGVAQARGVAGGSLDPQGVPWRLAPAVLAALRAGEHVSGPIELLGGGPAYVRLLQGAGISFELLVPIRVEGRFWGFLSLGDNDPQRLRQAENLRLLRAVAGMIAPFLRPRQVELIRSFPDLLLGINLDGQICFVHMPTCNLLVLPPELLGRPAAAVLPPALGQLIQAAQAQPDAGQWQTMIRLAATEGRQAMTLEGRVVATQDGWLLIVRDMSEQSQHQAALERARNEAEATAQAKADFLASMSHEIRTPLNAVIGMAGLLLDTDLSTKQRSFAQTIVTGGQALLAVINNILDFSRLEGGHTQLEAQAFDLHSCISTALELVTLDAQQKGLALSYLRDPSVPQAVIGDGGRLRQVLLNLLGNAVKFTSQGQVSLSARAVAQGNAAVLLTIIVRDTGIGIEPEKLAHIFEPFVQADSTTSRQYGGTGLGLAICKQLVTHMGGWIEVDSTPGGGSTFEIQLPLTLATMPKLVRADERQVSAERQLRLLIAEDNLINQEVTRRLVQQLGHQVTVVANGQSAVDAVIQQTYDAVLMDVQMPQMGGEEATRQIRALGSVVLQPYIIALTASALMGDRERILEAGMDDYLSKPVEPGQLRRALERVPGGTLTEAQSMESGRLVDWARIEQFVAPSGQEHQTGAFITRLVEHVLKPELEQLADVVARGDGEALRRQAQRLYEGCIQIGALRMAEICSKLEQYEPERDPALVVAELETCYTQTRAIIRQRLRAR